MNVGWIGLGKLGLPCALVLAQHHDVWGYDVSDRYRGQLDGTVPLMQEDGIEDLVTGKSARRFGRCDTVAQVVGQADIVFVAVQTPHDSRYGGEEPMPGDRADFDYTWLAQACRAVCDAAAAQQKETTLVVISTVLPGTVNRLIRPLLGGYTRLVYSPQFIAMGTTIADFTDPEFVICGTESPYAAEQMKSVFLPVHGRSRLYLCDVTTAESIKVLYNTYISMKIVWANHVMEMCDKTGADCDRVVDALEHATDRVISSKYLRGGMGDGGACHPRDLIALSWLEDRLGMSYPLFTGLAEARESQTEWLAQMVRHYHRMTGQQVVVLGRSYKPGSDLTAGSPALLLRHYLADLHPWQYDPHTGSRPEAIFARNAKPMVYVVATRHPEFKEFSFRDGSVVIDPFGYIPDQGPKVTVVRPGRRGAGS